MREAITKVYEFKELSEEAREKAINKMRDINVDFDWWEDDYLMDMGLSEKAKERLSKEQEEVLFKWDNIYFDLDRANYLQFEDLTITNDDIFREVLEIPLDLWSRLYYQFENDRNSNTEIEFIENDYNYTPEDEEILDKAESIFSDLIWDALSHLKKQADYLQTDEAIIDTIEANDYEFTIEGELF